MRPLTGFGVQRAHAMRPYGMSPGAGVVIGNMPDESSESTTLAASVDLPARYEKRGIIGQGGMGVVVHAHDLQLGRDVAIKVLNFEGARDSQTQERLLREAKTLANLDHPNIVKLLSSGVTDSGSLYLVMEFLDGVALSNEIGEGKRLSPTRFYQIFSQVLAGLSYAHGQGIVHRDCKPSNIILYQSEEMLRAKLIDFGIARSQGADQNLTKTGSMLGSPRYMSPEQCKGTEVDQRSDIYSIACVMYESLMGSAPHQGDTVMDLMYKQLHDEAPKLETIATDPLSKQLGKLIDTCLEKDPSARPQTTDAVLAELNQIFKDRIDTGKLFASKAANSPGKKTSLLVVTLLIIVAGSAVLVPVLHKKPDMSRDKAAALSDNNAKEMRQLELSALARKRAFNSQQSDGEKAESAKRYMEALQKLADKEREMNHFSSSEKWLSEALSLCPRFGNGAGQARATILKDLADGKASAGDFAGAEKVLDAALKEDIRANGTRAELYFQQARTRILKREFDKALASFEQTIEYAREGDSKFFANSANETHFSRQFYGNKLRTHTSTQAVLLWNVLKRMPVNDCAKVSCVKLLNTIAEICIDEGIGSSSMEALSRAVTLLGKADRREAQYNLVAAKTYTLLERLEAEIENNSEKAHEYKMMAQKYSQVP